MPSDFCRGLPVVSHVSPSVLPGMASVPHPSDRSMPLPLSFQTSTHTATSPKIPLHFLGKILSWDINSVLEYPLCMYFIHVLQCTIIVGWLVCTTKPLCLMSIWKALYLLSTTVSSIGVVFTQCSLIQWSDEYWLHTPSSPVTLTEQCNSSFCQLRAAIRFLHSNSLYALCQRSICLGYRASPCGIWHHIIVYVVLISSS